MGCTCELFCVVQRETVDEVTTENEWATFRWFDEFGNSIAPFFTSLESGHLFLQDLQGWQLRRYPVHLVVEVILFDIKLETSFYAIDPLNTSDFKTLSAAQFLTELIYGRVPLGLKTQELIHEHPDIVPIEDFYLASSDSNKRDGYTQLLADAELIFAIDEATGKQSIVFGKESLEEILRCGQCNILGIVNVGLDLQTKDLTNLASMVQEIKGHHDCCGVGIK
jgi:hypothetical protein